MQLNKLLLESIMTSVFVRNVNQQNMVGTENILDNKFNRNVNFLWYYFGFVLPHILAATNWIYELCDSCCDGPTCCIYS